MKMSMRMFGYSLIVYSYNNIFIYELVILYYQCKYISKRALMLIWWIVVSFQRCSSKASLSKLRRNLLLRVFRQYDAASLFRQTSARLRHLPNDALGPMLGGAKGKRLCRSWKALISWSRLMLCGAKGKRLCRSWKALISVDRARCAHLGLE